MKRIVFLGTSEFAIPSLRALVDDGRFSVIGAVTQPDRPVGRHAVLTPPPVKTVALERGIPVFQPEKIKDLKDDATFQSLMDPRPDVFVVVSYGKILLQWFLDIPTHGIVNVHGSLLPRWRGASPLQAAILSGDAVTGVTIMKIDADLDHGPILASKEEPITSTDTSGSLHDRLAALGGTMLPDILADYLDGRLEPVEQDHSNATTCKTLTRDDGKIDWTKSAEEIERMVRAYDPWPSTWTLVGVKRLKILSARVDVPDTTKTPGELFLRDHKLDMSCGAGTVLELVRVQPEGKKPMSGATFVSP
ncbi:MAG: methionyl-tRNA formyltransferase [Patescibacteria group bacterium]